MFLRVVALYITFLNHFITKKSFLLFYLCKTLVNTFILIISFYRLPNKTYYKLPSKYMSDENICIRNKDETYVTSSVTD